MDKKKICMIADIPANGMKECEAAGGLKLLVANSGAEYFAVQPICPHQDVPLCEVITKPTTVARPVGVKPTMQVQD